MQEAEAVCGRIIIIDKGVIVADEEKDNIHQKIKGPKQLVRAGFDRETSDSDLLGIPGIKSAILTKQGEWLLEAESGEDIRPAIFSFAVKNNLTVLSLQKEESNLEEIFRQLTGR